MWHHETALQSFPKSLAPSEPLLLTNLGFKWSLPPQRARGLLESANLQKYDRDSGSGSVQQQDNNNGEPVQQQDDIIDLTFDESSDEDSDDEEEASIIDDDPTSDYSESN